MKKNELKNKITQLSLDYPLFYFLSIGSELDLKSFSKVQLVTCDRGPRKAMFWSVTVYSKQLSMQYNLTNYSNRTSAG